MSENKKKPRFRSVVSLANSTLSIKASAIILASSTLVSALLGIFRDRWLNSLYFTTYPTGLDAYTAAFTVPDFMYFILVSGALSVSFIPVFNQRLVSGNKKSAWELSSSILNLFAILTFIASILIMIFADPLVRYIVAPGLDESSMSLTINMMRVIAINPFLFSLSTVFSSIQQAVGRFVFFAVAPALYNVGILIGIFSFTKGINIFGLQVFEGGIMGVALGVVLGAVLQLITSVVGLIGLGFDYRFKIYWKNHGLRSVIKLLPARSLDQGLDYVMSIINTNLASKMGTQSIRAFQQANSLHSMPVNLIGVAISTAFFPELSNRVAKGDEEGFRQTFRMALRTIIWIAMPVAVIAYFARAYVVSFIQMSGERSIMIDVLAAFILAIFCQSVFHIASRAFYAHQDTKTPFVISIIAVGLNIVLAIAAFHIYKSPVGLAYAVSVSSLVEVLILLAIQNRRMDHQLFNKDFIVSFIKTIMASIVAGAASYFVIKILPPLTRNSDTFLTIMPKFSLIAIVGLVAYVLVSYVIGIEEAKPAIKKINRILFRNTK